MKMLSLRTASKTYNISYYALRKLCLDGKLQFVKIGNKFLISDIIIEDFLRGGGRNE